MNRLFIILANIAIALLCIPDYWKFRIAINDVEKNQQKILFNILKRNCLTEYGKRYKFDSIKSIKEFQTVIPLTSYNSYKNYIDRISKGQENILTEEKVEILEPSSGSTSATKLIPYTKSLRKEFIKGISPWLFDLYTKNKRLLLGKSYWSISPAINYDGPATIPIGFNHDTEYFGSVKKNLLDFLSIIPNEVTKIQDIEAFRYVTLLFLLREKSLSFISVWSPTFLTLLLDKLADWQKNLITDLKNGTISFPLNLDGKSKNIIYQKNKINEKRANELSQIFEHKTNYIFERIWPHLKVISCWGEANAENFLYKLQRYFPKTKIQKKGLIATEGFISFPLIGQMWSILSINSHFFEFIEENTNKIKLAHELERDKIYSVVITTSGGFYRYQLNDLVEVTGHKKQSPIIRFMGKQDFVSDLFGEKLNERHLSQILIKLFAKHRMSPTFYMVAPENDKITNDYFYCLFIESDNDSCLSSVKSVSKELEEELLKNYHYNYCRKLGQLKKIKIFIIKYQEKAENVYIKECGKMGQRLGNIKRAALHKKIGWSQKFNGQFFE